MKTCYAFLVFVFANLIIMTIERNTSCGIDNSAMTYVYEGLSKIEYYPWIGILYYPARKKRYTTAVVLVTRQAVIGTATEIDTLPKRRFRKLSKVILGHDCTGPPIKVRDYAYHPEFRRDSYTALTLIQLDVDEVEQDCKSPMIRIHEMTHVDPQECRTYYRKSGLDLSSIWPAHTACAKAKSGKECVWRSGTILVMRQGIRWRLLGFGVQGPGCEAPARFLDYGMYHSWVRTNIARIGRTAITRVAPDFVILRRSLSRLQRFGQCDREERQVELYSDSTNITGHFQGFQRMKLNITLYANVEYSCVLFKLIPDDERSEKKPSLRLRRWCSGERTICHGFQLMELDFYVEIFFERKVLFKMRAYGKQASVIDSYKAMSYANSHSNQTKPDIDFDEKEIQQLIKVGSFKWD